MSRMPGTEAQPIATLSASEEGAPSRRRQLATSCFIYPHLTSVALTTADLCPTLAGYGP